jgi:two-component system, chemotaxis family, chemotaxis protein CheY
VPGRSTASWGDFDVDLRDQDKVKTGGIGAPKEAIDLRKVDVLVVDDNGHMRALVRQVLTSMGVGSVREASDGMVALTLLKERRTDVIITDWMMEPLNGIEFVQLLRTAPDSPDPEVAVIMLTGHTERARIVQARDAGVDEFLAKPFSPRALYDRVYEVIANPRPFVRRKGYAGPEQRAQTRPDQDFSRRRRSKGIAGDSGSGAS